MATGILYTEDNMVFQALTRAFVSKPREGRLYHFRDFSCLSEELARLEAKFILLDINHLPPLLPEHKKQLADCQIPIFCLGENAPVGLSLPRPFNPLALMLAMDRISDPLGKGMDILKEPRGKSF